MSDSDISTVYTYSLMYVQGYGAYTYMDIGGIV